MARIIESPVVVPAAGEPAKRIEEYIGRVASGTEAVSIARMVSPAGWREPAQRPEFDEYTVVLRGALTVELADGVHRVTAGQAIVVPANETVRYSSPNAEGAEYIAVCLPAFSSDMVHRDAT